MSPEFEISLFTINPPVPVASRIPELITTFDPVSMVRAWVPVGDNRSLVNEHRLPIAKLAGARNRVVHVGERDTWESARDEILRRYRTV